MNIDRFERNSGVISASVEHTSPLVQAECGLERTARRAEGQWHIARCGFEVVSVTTLPHTGIGACDPSGSAEASEQSRMVSSLISVLEAEQKVTFIYEGG
ncbi:MAG: hypothetical protein WCI73_18255, partial [Phycisphaerae bacterium]